MINLNLYKLMSTLHLIKALMVLCDEWQRQFMPRYSNDVFVCSLCMLWMIWMYIYMRKRVCVYVCVCSVCFMRNFYPSSQGIKKNGAHS